MFRTLLATFVAFVFVFMVPVMASAAPAFTRVEVDRTSITAGQSVTISVRTTAETQFVFATVGGTRVQGTRVSGNDWNVVVSPTQSATVSVFANRNNNESGAALVTIPITVTGAATPTPTPTPPTVTIPAAPANLAPIAIASVTETPAQARGQVQLTVVAGREVNEVWVNFDRHVGDGRFARGTMVSQDANSRTFVINFTPRAWASQQVEIGANRTYNWPGAARRNHTLELTQPFVAPANPAIQNVTVNNRTVAPGSNVSFTIRTNLDVEYVWVRDIDGREHNATRGTSTAASRNWTVSFNPVRTGQVRVYANATRTATGASTRTESITVGLRSSIVSANASTWGHTHIHHLNDVRITATTNRDTQTVWAVLSDGRRVQLNETTGAGTGNRTWEAWAHNVPSGTIVVHASGMTGNINNLSSDDTRNVTWGGGHVGTGHIISTTIMSGHSTSRGQQVIFSVRTTGNISVLQVRDMNGNTVPTQAWPTDVGNEREWQVIVTVPHHVAVSGSPQTVFRVEAFIGGSSAGSRDLPAITVW